MYFRLRPSGRRRQAPGRSSPRGGQRHPAARGSADALRSAACCHGFGPLRRRRRRRRGIAHEALERRDDRGRLLRGGAGRDQLELRLPVHGERGYRAVAMPTIPVLDHDAVLAAVTPAAAIDTYARAFSGITPATG